MNEDAVRTGALEDRAARARARLEHTLELIQQRKDRWADTAKAISRPPTSIVIGAVVGVAATAFIVQRRRARRRRSSFRALWQDPTPPQKGIVAQGLQDAGLSLLKLLAQRLATRGVAHLLSKAESLPLQNQTPHSPWQAKPRAYRSST